MMMTIKCPKCSVDGKMSLVNPDYHGPYKCWSCRQLYTIDIKNNAVVSCEPLSQEEYDKQHPPKPSFDMNVGNARDISNRNRF